MSYKVFFDFSSGLSKSIKAPKGTLKKTLDHVQRVELMLGYEITQYRENPPHWKSMVPKDGVTDKTFCEVAENHNNYVRRLYDLIAECSKNPPKDCETITPKKAASFWHGLTMITVPPQRWTRDYYVARMECLYEAMRGRESEGAFFSAKALTPDQCAAVMILFSEYLDTHDVRLDVPRGHDSLAASDDGGYEWCEKCGAITYEDAIECRKRGCLLGKELRAEANL